MNRSGFLKLGSCPCIRGIQLQGEAWATGQPQDSGASELPQWEHRLSAQADRGFQGASISHPLPQLGEGRKEGAPDWKEVLRKACLFTEPDPLSHG